MHTSVIVCVQSVLRIHNYVIELLMNMCVIDFVKESFSLSEKLYDSVIGGLHGVLLQLAVESRDLSQDEKKKLLMEAEKIHQISLYLTRVYFFLA